MQSEQKLDWRTLPRKPGKLKKKCRLSVRCTEMEKAAIMERAAMAGMELSEYVVIKCLGRKRPAR